MLEVLANAVRQDKKREKCVGKKEIEWSLLSANRIIYTENLKRLTIRINNYIIIAI